MVDDAAAAHAQDALAVAQAWLNHYAHGEPAPAWPLSDFEDSSARFYAALYQPSPGHISGAAIRDQTSEGQ